MGKTNSSDDRAGNRLQEENVSEQLSIFHSYEQIERTEKVDRVVDEIRDRFGWKAITSAATLKLDKMPHTDDEIELTMPTGMLTLS